MPIAPSRIKDFSLAAARSAERISEPSGAELDSAEECVERAHLRGSPLSEFAINHIKISLWSICHDAGHISRRTANVVLDPPSPPRRESARYLLG